MLYNPEDWIREFPINLRTNRDAENPTLIEFVRSHPDIESLLDIGAHNSWANYAPEIRKLVSRYDAVDILPDPQTAVIVDSYDVGNANDAVVILPWDCVTCVSCFEHSGISTYKGVQHDEVLKLFKKCIDLSDKYVWVSFDIGSTAYLTPGQHCPITYDLYKQMLALIPERAKVKKRFFYTQGCQANHPWYEHEKEEVAFRIPYISYIGNQSIAVLEIEK